MNTITIAKDALNANAIANLIKAVNSNEWDGKIAIGNALIAFRDADGYKADGFKSMTKWIKAQCDSGLFRVKADQCNYYIKVAEFLKSDFVIESQWRKMNFTCCRLLLDAIKHCEVLVEFVNLYADELAELPQKKVQEFCRLLKAGMKPLDALNEVQNPTLKIETEDLNPSEETDTIGTAAEMSDHIDIKANLVRILAMMKAKEYADAEASLEAMIEAL